MGKSILIILLLTFINSFQIFSQQILLDDFESTEGWKIYKSDGVDASISLTEGLYGKSIKFDFDFTKGSGYGGIQKLIPLDLPENYKFTFFLKAESPNNNLEFKLLDKSGDNVWWVNNRNYEFPNEWIKITVKKKHIDFAWGPTEDKNLKSIEKLEFTIASFSGGKGSVYIDELRFEQIPPEGLPPKAPILFSSNNSDQFLHNLIDGDIKTAWQSSKNDSDFILIDFQQAREFGGFIIDWNERSFPESFDISFSDDGKSWLKILSLNNISGQRSYVRLKEAETRFAKIVLHNSNNQKGFEIYELKILDPGYSSDLNRFLINIAKDFPRGYFPRYFYEEASYWNVIGVNGDVREALINEDGMIEVDKARFSIEPMLYINHVPITWNDVEKENSLEENYLPIPIVNWEKDDLTLEIKSFAEGEANKSSVLYSIYKIKNNGSKQAEGKILLLIKPFQVNPYYQWLNLTGGVSAVSKIKIKNNFLFVDDNKVIYSPVKFDSAFVFRFADGNILKLLTDDKGSLNSEVEDQFKLANGVLVYDYILKPGEEKLVYLAIPFYEANTLQENLDEGMIEQKLKETIDFWKSKINHVKFNLPESADKIINTYKSNLAYILINRDKFGIQPGSRSYERSWIRDGSLTSSALLKAGIVEEVREFINWYSEYQYENGKIPCVVDSRGPDPVPEHDSHGEMIYLIREYCSFTKDTTFLRSKNENVKKAFEFIESLIAERSIDHYKNGNDSVRAYYGIMPESISHEGYSAKPMHSYWDNFFTMKGLKDATEIQKILGEKESYERIKKIRDTFKENLYNSLKLAMKKRKIDYIPGCVELGDFDATSTTIALTPCNELSNLPKPQVYNTFDKYYEYFKNRRENKTDWVNYTPYENRLIGSFILLDQPEHAHELIEFFLDDQRPDGWNHWAEVVWKDERIPRFIGDMPHTWVGSDFINAVRAMFVYENDYDSSLVIGAGLYKDWTDAKDGMSVENLPTYYGELNYSIRKDKNIYTVELYGDIVLPSGGIILKNFNESKMPKKVLVNEKEIKNFSENKIIVEFPATVKIFY